MICPQCGIEVHDANDKTVIADHNMCYDCHKKWQHGELLWQEEWNWGMDERFVAGVKMRITHDITLEKLYDIQPDYKHDWVVYLETIYGVEGRALSETVAIKRGAVATLVEPDTNYGDCTSWIAKVEGFKLEEIDLHPEDAVFEEDWNE